MSSSKPLLCAVACVAAAAVVAVAAGLEKIGLGRGVKILKKLVLVGQVKI